MEDKEAKVLICLPVEGDDARYIVPGSIGAKCADCQIPVYMAPSGQKLANSESVIIVCIECGLIRLKKETEPKFRMVPGQDEEIRQYLKHN